MAGDSSTDDAKRKTAPIDETDAVSPEAGMRMYAAILGHPPEVDPELPDPFATGRRKHLTDLLPHSTSSAESTPTWRQLLDHAASATEHATRRLEQARQRLRDRAA
ncbi:MAG: hypothetical protein AAGI46_06830 [Planctomycetota bacterium]